MTAGKKELGVSANRYRGSLWVDGNVLELDSGECTKTTELYILKQNFYDLVCEMLC